MGIWAYEAMGKWAYEAIEEGAMDLWAYMIMVIRDEMGV